MASAARNVVALCVLLVATASWAEDPAAPGGPPGEELLDLGITGISYREAGTPSHLVGDLGRVRPEHAEVDVQGIVQQLTRALKTTGEEGFWMYSRGENESGHYYKMRQTLHGYPVRGGRLTFFCDPDTGDVTEIAGKYLPADTVPKEAQISAREAYRNVPAYLQERLQPIDGLRLAERSIEEIQEPEKQYEFDPGGHGRLVWRYVVDVTPGEAPTGEVPSQLWEVLIDASDGSKVRLDSIDLDGKQGDSAR